LGGHVTKPIPYRLRSSLREKMQASPLMNAAGFARDIEAAYRKMRRTWCEQSQSLPCPL
jgi:hypothetical protein